MSFFGSCWLVDRSSQCSTALEQRRPKDDGEGDSEVRPMVGLLKFVPSF